MTSEEKIARAEVNFEIAKRITSGDINAAQEYAESSLAHYIKINSPYHKRIDTEAKRERYLKFSAESARRCAVKIAADGRAYYRDEAGLILCTLTEDVSAGAVGYDRL